ncbi:SRPBCC domain-containing protein [Pedobacter sp. HMF7647]|uniref:SRPBCC domain-containing protein n=1 Tax=Hufsiella arboris TaxID=2695275 RepID=A0A7K1YDH4_9SPHI|nr:SRPBCC domain-containing protein [Hufsiella arboris]MXV52647.1 SRPBCC domain-containing protein [Hufsiella arboris]
MFSTKNDSVTLEMIFRVPIEKVWQAWTDPRLLLLWFGSDPNGKGLKAELDVRPGGSFEITFRDSNNTEHTCFGVYSDVNKFSHLAFSWTWKSEPGVESSVTVELSSDGDNTRMHFRHADLGFSSAHDYQEGWKTTFQKLEKVLTNDRL